MTAALHAAPQALQPLLAGMFDDVPSVEIKQLRLDSREVEAGDLFIALRGQQHDGRVFLAQAATAGAAAALVEDALPDDVPPGLPVVVVPKLRHLLGEIASRFYQHPSRKLHIAAVTGTNGKTTVSQLFAQLVRSAGYDCGVIGTLGASLDGRSGPGTHTTPDAIALQSILAEWAGQAVPFVGMEASSHALDQGRMVGLELDTAIFTNLTRDHLDYHGDMTAYGEAKARLFVVPSLRTVILNDDDPFSAALATSVPAGCTVLRYGSKHSADVCVHAPEYRKSTMHLRIDSPWGSARVKCPLLGNFNAMNLAAALTAALQAGMPYAALLDAVEELQAVPGRMEPLRAAGAPLVVIDYAHTPDALQQVLAALREQCAGQLIAVFGCGGDRDRGKRALMGEAVSKSADKAVLTSDNPRSEDPRRIISDIEAGMSSDYEVCVDRAEAIRLAIGKAGSSDCVLIAGKGHEDYQIVGTQRLSFSDLDVARQALDRVAA